MSKFLLNGKEVEIRDDQKLLEFLREEMKLTSVKNGCNEGVCGTCTVLVDGKPKKSCITKGAKLDGAEVTTLEGIDEKEKLVYADAFAVAGASQCGFCIPGMVVAAKGILNENPEPTREEVTKGIKNNICRCTGYKKIEDAILLAADSFNSGNKIEQPEGRGVGSRRVRPDAFEKTMGTAVYADDIFMEDMLWAKVKRVPVPRAMIKGIDTSKAKDLLGVAAVLTSEDIPGGNYQGYLIHDWPTLVPVGEATRFIGDAIAIVAAESKAIAEAALELIEIDYEELPALSSPQEALAEGADKLHEKGNLVNRTHLVKHDVDEAEKNSAFVVEGNYFTPQGEHAFMEPEATVTYYDEDGVLVVISGTQSVHHDHHELCYILGLEHKEVRVESVNIGGGFGGKEDLLVQHHAALLTYHTKRPVKLIYTRQESLMTHPKRHAFHMDMKMGCDENGHLTFIKAKILSDTGAYNSLGKAVTERGVTHCAGPYKIKNIDVDGYAVYTNNPPSGAYRGFGVPQVNFAREQLIDELAAKVGIDGWQMRERNIVHPGDMLPTGQIMEDNCALPETLEAVKEQYYAAKAEGKAVGVACAHKNTGIGVGLSDIGRANIIIEDGEAVIYSSAARIGQGLVSVMEQIVAETIQDESIPVRMEKSCSWTTPDAGATTASRQTCFTGEASKVAATKLREALDSHSIKELEGQHFEGIFDGVTDPLITDKEHPRNHVAYSFATQLAILNPETKLLDKFVAAHDIGKAINPTNVEGQIEGGVTMSLGYAYTENFKLENSYLKAKYGTLRLFRADQVPEIESILIEKNPEGYAYGAKGIGEISSIPTAAAIAIAYHDLDGERRTRLPLENTPFNKRK